MNDAAIQQKLAAMFAANKDEVSVPKIYIDMTGGWETGAVLDEILFWTLPKKSTGRTSLRVFREQKLWLAVRRAEWWERKRLTERQADTAINKLVLQGMIEKDVFLFDGKPTVHLRLFTEKFASIYAQKMQEYAAQEDDENLIRDISDLYAMMGFPNENVISNLQNGKMLNLQNGEIINSPVQPENTSVQGHKTDEKKPSYRIKGIEAAMYQDRPVTSDDLPEWEAREKAACDAFESAFGIDRPWNWYPAKSTQENEWAELRAYLVQLYEADNTCFVGYATWANDKYSRGAKNASQIRQDPGAFPTAWAAYKASEMYKTPQPKNPETKYYTPPQGEFVPAPEKKL